ICDSPKCRSCVCVFAALVAKEIASAVDKWCLDQTVPQSSKSVSSQLSDGRASESGTEFEADLPRISESSPSLHHRKTAAASGDTRSDFSGTGRSRVYDAVMDTVIRFIE